MREQVVCSTAGWVDSKHPSCITQPFEWRRILRRSFAGSRGSMYCLRGGEAMRGAGPCGSCASSAGCTHANPAQGGSLVCLAARPLQAWGHADPAQFPRVPRSSRGPPGLAGHSIRKQGDPLVWHGSTREGLRLESWACEVTCVVCNTVVG